MIEVFVVAAVAEESRLAWTFRPVGGSEAAKALVVAEIAAKDGRTGALER